MTSTGLYANQTCTNRSVFKRNFSRNICVKAYLSDFTFSFVFFKNVRKIKRKKGSSESFDTDVLRVTKLREHHIIF